jgi:polynucleotide 5'-hydroxyl-kinase GRC3/NOL9
MIDADIGQKDIGPPACITSGFPGATAGNDPAGAAALYFVGGVNPFGRFLRMVVGAGRLTDSADASFKIVDTTGLVNGPGGALKDSKIEALRPHVIVAIQRSSELELLLNAHRNRRILRIPVSAKATARTRDERRLAREAAFYEYLQSAVEVEVGLDKLIFQRSRIFNGTPIQNPDFVYCEESTEGTLVVTGGNLPQRPKLTVVRPGFEENLLCGVADANGAGLGLAIIRKIDFPERRIRLLSAVDPGRIEILQFGDIYVNADGKELGSRKPGGF